MANAERMKEKAVAFMRPNDSFGKTFYECEQDQQSIQDCVNLLEQIYPDKVILLCKTHHVDSVYAGGTSMEIWGIPLKKLETLTAEDMVNLVHADDLPSVMWGINRLKDFAAGVDPCDVKFNFTYRMRSANGEYCYMLDEKVAVKTKNGNYAYFNIFSKIKDYKGPVALVIYKRVADGRMVKMNEYHINLDNETFSSREVDIIKLLDKGFNNSEIANSLSLSIFTVKNHKQNMFKKVNAKNSLELLRYARSRNLV